MATLPLEQQVEDAAQKAGGLLRSRYGLWALGAVSFFESALPVPIITDPFLVAYILASKQKAVAGLIVTTLTSLLGGIFAYVLAYAFYEAVAAQYLVGHIGEQFAAIATEFQYGTFYITLLGAITPVPYTLVALAAGFVQANFVVFIVATLAGRLFRYGALTWLTYRFGEQALAIAKRQLLLVTLVCFALVIYFYLTH